jgi:prepilin-type N-terminal cleavage/methylation domain-containing protein
MPRQHVTHTPALDQRGASLIELMVALAVLSLGVLAIAQLFPAGSRGQLQDRMMTSGSLYAQQKIEALIPLTWADPDLAVGRHPGAGFEDLGGGSWHRFYQVDILPAPLDNLKRVTVTVNWTFLGARSVTATTYIRR